MPFLSHTQSLERAYRVFDKHLAKEYPGEYSFIIDDYDDISKPLLLYIYQYDHQPNVDSVNDHYHNYDPDVPPLILHAIKAETGIPEIDLVYFVTLLAMDVSHIPEDLMQRAIGSFSQPHDCVVDIRRVSRGHWMYSIS